MCTDSEGQKLPHVVAWLPRFLRWLTTERPRQVTHAATPVPKRVGAPDPTRSTAWTPMHVRRLAAPCPPLPSRNLPSRCTLPSPIPTFLPHGLLHYFLLNARNPATPRQCSTCCSTTRRANLPGAGHHRYQDLVTPKKRPSLSRGSTTRHATQCRHNNTCTVW